VRADRGGAAVDGELLSLFALLALTIAATGIVGYGTGRGQRRHEIGVRMASVRGREKSCAWFSVRAMRCVLWSCARTRWGVGAYPAAAKAAL